MLKLPDHRAPFAEAASRIQISAAIAISRVLCILGVVYAHAWTGLDGGQLAAANASDQGILRWVVMEVLGRSSVPLLSMISGWLVLTAAWSRSYGSFLAGKGRTILVPMLLWNAIAMLVISGSAVAGLMQAPMPQSPLNAADQFFSLTAPNETNVQMAFLRDLFVCMAIAPWLISLRSSWLAAIMVLAMGWSISGLAFPLLLRPAILVFFVAGMLVRRGAFEMRVAAIPLAFCFALFAALALAKVDLVALQGPFADRHPALMAAIDLALRFAAALFFWRLAWALAGSRAGGAIMRLEPYAFLIFCSHLIFIWIGGPLIGAWTGPLGSPLYPAFLLAQPLLAAIAAIGLGALLHLLAPRAATLLSGGRLRPAVRSPGEALPARHSPGKAGQSQATDRAGRSIPPAPAPDRPAD